ncbi:MAG: energy transducer TonB [Bacteroidales bacterium]|nr:energy transducer TonB [Bacteroidales bacterium]
MKKSNVGYFYFLALLVVLGSCKSQKSNKTQQADTETSEDMVIDEIAYPMEDLEQTNDSSIFTVIEDSPEFPGGQDSLMAYLNRNIHYPKEAMEKGIEGTVYVTFVIEKDGSVNKVQILRGIGKACDEEAMRVIRNMSRWKPGFQRGKPVRVQYNIPIKFQLPEE